MLPNAPSIHKQGEVDSWDNAGIGATVNATGKKQTDHAARHCYEILCVYCLHRYSPLLRTPNFCVRRTLPSLISPPGGLFCLCKHQSQWYFSDRLAADANRCVEQAGVHLIGMFGIVTDLMSYAHRLCSRLNVAQRLEEPPGPADLPLTSKQPRLDPSTMWLNWRYGY